MKNVRMRRWIWRPSRLDDIARHICKNCIVEGDRNIKIRPDRRKFSGRADTFLLILEFYRTAMILDARLQTDGMYVYLMKTFFTVFPLRAT